MSNIKISELRPADSENYLTDLTYMDSMLVYGGEEDDFTQMLNFGVKSLEFMLLSFAIYNNTLLAKSFNPNGNVT
ncbi:hypothetical protein HUN01_22270 [Nostoc edaphicum CCNP1411]|uniref:Uncharacterized protein n=1 Tax=Nostoc edaphicum CCNP1411 TaxID=1472755 RepID=A0A7D7QEI7_9NOSO|nr:hypothetical protein [Nostoc edaphicum]QMS90179.1 hypothetical protein HUN01_22270 [Nostoc edaphicum CCNP1411]